MEGSYKKGEFYTENGELFLYKGKRNRHKRDSYYDPFDDYHSFQNVKTGKYVQFYFTTPKKASDKTVEKFLEKWTKEVHYKGLDYTAKFFDDCAKIGCQTIPKESLKEIAQDILRFYGEK